MNTKPIRSVTVVALLALASTSVACGSDPESVCGQAGERLHGCGLSAIHLTSVKMYTFGDDCSAAPCDGASECIAQCFNAASCGELQTVVPGGALQTCLAACNSYFRSADAGP